MASSPAKTIYLGANEPQERALDNIRTLMETEKYSDLVIKCQGRKFKVHKAIMCTASSVIAAECDHKMKEAENGVIEHSEFDADTVERMITCIYTLYYDVPEGYECTTPVRAPTAEGSKYEVTRVVGGINAQLLAHIKLYGIADFYNLPLLKVQAETHFADLSYASWDLDGFIEVVREMYRRTTTMDCGLRGFLHCCALKHIEEMTGDEHFMTEPAESEDVQDFAAKMLRQMAKQRNDDKEAHREELQQKEDEISDLANQLVTAASKQAQTEADKQKAEEEVEYAEGVMQHLANGLRNLPPSCTNGICHSTFGELYCERKSSTVRGEGKGNWMVRCGECRARLIK